MAKRQAKALAVPSLIQRQFEPTFQGKADWWSARAKAYHAGTLIGADCMALTVTESISD